MRELERRYPTPSFYPASHGVADALAWWAEMGGTLERDDAAPSISAADG
jgi:hypothetical protein